MIFGLVWVDVQHLINGKLLVFAYNESEDTIEHFIVG